MKHNDTRYTQSSGPFIVYWARDSRDGGSDVPGLTCNGNQLFGDKVMLRTLLA